MIDADNDGYINEEDLRQILLSTSSISNLEDPSHCDHMAKKMLSGTAGGTSLINFTMFLSLFGEKLSVFDPEFEILGAFHTVQASLAYQQQHQKGLISIDELKNHLMSMGSDPLTEEEVFVFIAMLAFFFAL